ncbi:MAG: helicase-related protein [Promethearchaeia archaeon]
MVFDLTMVRILDNSKNKKVLDTIKYLIKKPDMKQLSFAVGYFYLNGWNLIKEDFPENPPKNFMRILIGRELDLPTFKEIKKGYRLKLKTNLLDDLSEVNEENIDKIKDLYYLIKNGIIDFKIYLESKLHSKLYLFIDRPEELKLDAHRSPGTAILGSSNFTVPGTLTNRELNSEFTQAEAVKELQKWFDNLWNNYSEEFREDLIKIINASNILKKDKKNPIGKYVPPKQLFKYLTWIWLRGKIEPLEKDDVLAQFQLVGVLNAIEMISEFNGCIVADSVGLGKSFIGATIIEEYITGKLPEWDPYNEGFEKIRKALLILPPSLIKQWIVLLFKSKDFFTKNICIEEIVDKGFIKYKIIGRESERMGQIGEVAFLSLGKFGLMSPEEIYKNKLNEEYDLILIDEAHKFRNNWTKRWKNIRAMRYKIPDNPYSFNNKYILLTATPVNNNIWDVFNLIKIFSDNNFINFKKRNIPITNLFSEYRDAKKKWKEDKREEANLRMKAQAIKDNIFKKIMILRTRKYIMSEFGERGKINIRGRSFIFKDPIPDKITYKSDDLDFKPYNKFLEVLEKEFEDLEFAFTRLYSSSYIAFNPRDSLQNEKNENQKKIMVPINAILKFLLAKRLESSIFAFERTLTKIMKKNQIFFKILKEFINKIEKLDDDEFIKSIQEFSLICIKKADKESAIIDFEEDNIDMDEYIIDPRLRLIYNLISYYKNDLLENLIDYMKREEKFYEFVKNTSDKSKILEILKSGLKLLYNKIKRDEEIFNSVKNIINTVKVKENEKIKILNEFSEGKDSIKIPEYYDPKINRLKEIIYNDLIGKKFIIFTQYKDTAIYLHTILKSWLINQKIRLPYIFENGELKLALVTGDTDIKQKQIIIERFAPYANEAKEYYDQNNIEILISTDTLSEGVNLQDANGVINYDLPWNPMQIVQRVGRVNRIGNEKEVFVKNFVPIKELDAIIGILEKLTSKIKDITYLVGKEFYILSEDEEISPEIFEKKILDLASAKMSRLEEISQMGDSKILGDIIHEEEIAKFKLLNYIQNELKLRQDDFDEIRTYLDKKQILYTLIKPQEIFRIYEIYRGNTKSGHYILKLNKDGKITETTCEQFFSLWKKNELMEDIDIDTLKSNVDKLDKYFKEEILEKVKGLQVQDGFLKSLFTQFTRLTLYNTFPDETIDKMKLYQLIDNLPFIEMNTKEIKEFTDYLKKENCITDKKKVKNGKMGLLIDKVFDYFNLGKETKRKLNFRVLGWCD